MHVAEFSSLVFCAKRCEIQPKEAKEVGNKQNLGHVWGRIPPERVLRKAMKCSLGGTLQSLACQEGMNLLGGCRSASAWKWGTSEVSRAYAEAGWRY